MIFESDTAELKLALETLRKETEEHLRLVQEEIGKNITVRNNH